MQVICHCWDCKRTSGSAFSSNVIVPEGDLKIEGPTKEFKTKVPSGNTGAYAGSHPRSESLKYFFHTAVTRLFCGNCGSALSHHSPVFGGGTAVQTGNFDYFTNVPIVAEGKFPDPSLSVRLAERHDSLGQRPLGCFAENSWCYTI